MWIIIKYLFLFIIFNFIIIVVVIIWYEKIKKEASIILHMVFAATLALFVHEKECCLICFMAKLCQMHSAYITTCMYYIYCTLKFSLATNQECFYWCPPLIRSFPVIITNSAKEAAVHLLELSLMITNDNLFCVQLRLQRWQVRDLIGLYILLAIIT